MGPNNSTHFGTPRGWWLGAAVLSVAMVPPVWARQSTRDADQRPPEVRSGVLPEPAVIGRLLAKGEGFFGDGDTKKSGFYPQTTTGVSGAGWISLGPGYRASLFRDRLLVDASGVWSWRSYKVAQVGVELPTLAAGRLVLGAQLRWQDLTQVTYFGEGADSLIDNRSEYRLTSRNAVGYATLWLRSWLAATGRAGYVRPDVRAPAGSFRRNYPDTRDLFGADIVYAQPSQPSFTYGEAALVADTRDHRGYPSRGGVYRSSWTRYRDGDRGLFNFDRFEAEAAHFVPLPRQRWVLAVHGWTVTTDVPAGSTVPFYFLPSLGGGTTLRGSTGGRFHGRHLLLTTFEARYALFDHIDVAAFMDAGGVANRYRDLEWSERSYGAGLRLHTEHATVARLDVAHGPTGWRVVLKLNDPLHLKHLSRRTAALPFVP
jgi:hypothetical protein